MVEAREAVARKLGKAVLDLVTRQRQQGFVDPSISIQDEGDRLLIIGVDDGFSVEVSTAS